MAIVEDKSKMKMTDQDEFIIFAPCGMNCTVCYVHLKRKNLVMDVWRTIRINLKDVNRAR